MNGELKWKEIREKQMQENMEVETGRQRSVKESSDSQGDIKLSISNSTFVSTLKACEDLGRLPSGGLPGDGSGWEKWHRPTGTGIPLQVASSKSWWWQVHPRQERHWQENPLILWDLASRGQTVYRLLDRWPLWSDPTQQFSWSHEHAVLMQNRTIGFRLNFPHLLPQGLWCFMCSQHRTESRCNQVTTITRPCTAPAHVSRTRVLREISLCTITVLALSHCLQISRKINICKYRNTIIQLPHCDPERCWKEHHVQPCKHKSLQETGRALKLYCSNVHAEWAAAEIANGDIVCSGLIKPLSSFNKTIFR